MSLVAFELPERAAARRELRALLVAQVRYERVRAVREVAVNLLAVVGSAFTLARARALALLPAARLVGLLTVSGLLGVVAVAVGLEILWQRRRDRAAEALRA